MRVPQLCSNQKALTVFVSNLLMGAFFSAMKITHTNH